MYAKSVSQVVTRMVPITIIAFLLPSGWGLTLPPNIWCALLFFVNLIIGSLLVVALNMLCYCMMFKTMSSIGIFSIMATVSSLFNGSLIPVPLTPVWFQRLLDFLPFRYINDLTFRTYSGSIPLMEALKQTGIQIVWLIVIVLIGKLWLNKSLKKVEIQGG
jgi:ABC-2 type transport system permease protein